MLPQSLLCRLLKHTPRVFRARSVPSWRALPVPPRFHLVHPLFVVLKLTQAEIGASSRFSTRVFLACTAYAVYAAAGAGSTECVEPFLLPHFECLAFTTCAVFTAAGVDSSR